MSDTGPTEYLAPLDPTDLGMQPDTYPTGDLTPADAEDMPYMQEEEKLAGNVYASTVREMEESGL